MSLLGFCNGNENKRKPKVIAACAFEIFQPSGILIHYLTTSDEGFDESYGSTVWPGSIAPDDYKDLSTCSWRHKGISKFMMSCSQILATLIKPLPLNDGSMSQNYANKWVYPIFLQAAGDKTLLKVYNKCGMQTIAFEQWPEDMQDVYANYYVKENTCFTSPCWIFESMYLQANQTPEQLSQTMSQSSFVKDFDWDTYDDFETINTSLGPVEKVIYPVPDKEPGCPFPLDPFSSVKGTMMLPLEFGRRKANVDNAKKINDIVTRPVTRPVKS